MRDPKELTRADVLQTANTFIWRKKMPKWTVIVATRELPARPLVLAAAGVAPNDPTNSHQAVALLERLGFETRYAGNGGNVLRKKEEHTQTGVGGLAEIARIFESLSESVPESEWTKVPSDLSKNLDHYLYGARKRK